MRKADHLSGWLETLLHLYDARILPVDVAAARLLSRLSDRARATGQTPGFADLAIAATAGVRGYTVLTRNLRYFLALDIASHDPFDTLLDTEPAKESKQFGSARTHPTGPPA